MLASLASLLSAPALGRATLALAALTSIGASNAPPATVRLSATPASTLTIQGSSNVHEWHCTATRVDAEVTIDAGYATAAPAALGSMLKSVSVKVPVKGIHCGKSQMDQNLYKALKADETGAIGYISGAFTVAAGATPEAFSVRAPGALQIAGAEQRVTIDVQAERLPDGRIRATGRVPLKMTAFGIQPPTALMGTLRTRDDIVVVIDLILA